VPAPSRRPGRGPLWGPSGAGAPAESASALSEPEALRSIGESETFREPIRVEAWSTLSSPTAEALTAGGYLERSSDSPILYRLTDKGRASGIDAVEFQVGTPVFRPPLALREIVAVTNRAEMPGGRPVMSVEFTYRTVLTPVGRHLRDAGSTLRELDGHGTPFRGSAQLAQRAGEWRVERIDLL